MTIELILYMMVLCLAKRWYCAATRVRALRPLLFNPLTLQSDKLPAIHPCAAQGQVRHALYTVQRCIGMETRVIQEVKHAVLVVKLSGSLKQYVRELDLLLPLFPLLCSHPVKKTLYHIVPYFLKCTPTFPIHPSRRCVREGRRDPFEEGPHFSVSCSRWSSALPFFLVSLASSRGSHAIKYRV